MPTKKRPTTTPTPTECPLGYYHMTPFEDMRVLGAKIRDAAGPLFDADLTAEGRAVPGLADWRWVGIRLKHANPDADNALGDWLCCRAAIDRALPKGYYVSQHGRSLIIRQGDFLRFENDWENKLAVFAPDYVPKPAKP